MFKKYLTALLLSLVSSTALAIATVDLIANPLAGYSPLNVTLSWTSVEVDSCVKDGVATTTSGTEAVIGLTIDTTYTIVCTGGRNYADISWIAPTLNVDGTTIPPMGQGALAGFEIFYSIVAANVETATPIIVPPAARTYRINGMPNSVYYYKMRAFNGYPTNNRSNFTNAITNTINYQIASDSVSVNIQAFGTFETVVYNLVKRTNGFIFVAVGTVPLNTPCDLTQSVNGYNVVPVASVTWTGTVRPVVVVARCTDQ